MVLFLWVFADVTVWFVWCLVWVTKQTAWIDVVECRSLCLGLCLHDSGTLIDARLTKAQPPWSVAPMVGVHEGLFGLILGDWIDVSVTFDLALRGPQDFRFM